MIITGGEEDGSGLITDKTLSDAGIAEAGGGGCCSALLQNRIRGQDLGDQGVAVGSRLKLIHFNKDWLSLLSLVYVPLLLMLLVWCRCCH